MPTLTAIPKLYGVQHIAEMFGISANAARDLMKRIGSFHESGRVYVTEDRLKAYFAAKSEESLQNYYAHQPVKRGRKPHAKPTITAPDGHLISRRKPQCG